MFWHILMLGASVVPVIPGALAGVPVAASPPAPSPVSPSELTSEIERLEVEVMFTPSATSYEKLGDLSLQAHGLLGERPDDELPWLVQGLRSWRTALGAKETMQERSLPLNHPIEIGEVLDAVGRSLDRVLDPTESLAIYGETSLLLRRLDMVPTELGADGQEKLVNGVTGTTWRRDAARFRALLGVEPGNLTLPYAVWSAQGALDNCSESYLPGNSGPADVLDRLRVAWASAQTDGGKRLVHRAKAGHHACEILFGTPKDRGESARGLFQEALILRTDAESRDADVAGWARLALVTMRDEAITRGDMSSLLEVSERAIAPAMDGVDFPEAAAFSFNIARMVRIGLAQEPVSARSRVERVQLLQRVDGVARRAVELGYRRQLIDERQRQALLSLIGGASLNLLGDLTDVAGTDWGMADREQRFGLAAAIELGRKPPVQHIAAPVVAYQPPVPDKLGWLYQDAATLADVLFTTAGKWPGDSRGETFANRRWTVSSLSALAREAEGRAALPGLLGMDARTAHLDVLTLTALGYAASGSPATACLIFEQIDAVEPGYLDLALRGKGQDTPREALQRWSTRKAEVRPVLLLVPYEVEADLEVVRTDEHAPPAPAWSTFSRDTWFIDPSQGEQAWMVAHVPMVPDVRLRVRGESIELPAGQDAVVARLQFVGGGWRLAPSPPPALAVGGA